MGRPLLNFPRFQSPNTTHRGNICNKRAIPFVTPSTETRGGTGFSVKISRGWKRQPERGVPKSPLEPLGTPAHEPCRWYLNTNLQSRGGGSPTLTRSSLYDPSFPAIQPRQGTA